VITIDIADSTKITDSKSITIDEAKKKLKLSGEKAKSFERKILEKQDTQFSQIMSVVFGWRIQEDGGKKLVSKLPCGKITFPDKSEDLDQIEPGIPYICLVYEPKTNPDGTQARQAYAKIICEEYIPIIFVPSSKIPVMVWIDDGGRKRNKVPVGNSYSDRMMILLSEAEQNGWPFVKVIFRQNQI